MMTLEGIGKQIAMARKAHGLRQVDLSVRAGVSRATVDALENGRASEVGFSKITRMLTAVGLELYVRPLNAKRPTLDDLMRERAEERDSRSDL